MNRPTPYELIHDIYQHHLETLIIYVLFDAFASFVEELAKYFFFWMVEHASQNDRLLPCFDRLVISHHMGHNESSNTTASTAVVMKMVLMPSSSTMPMLQQRTMSLEAATASMEFGYDGSGNGNYPYGHATLPSVVGTSHHVGCGCSILDYAVTCQVASSSLFGSCFLGCHSLHIGQCAMVPIHSSMLAFKSTSNQFIGISLLCAVLLGIW